MRNIGGKPLEIWRSEAWCSRATASNSVIVMITPLVPTSRLQQLTADIERIARHVNRDPASIHLLAVSKGQPREAIETLIQQGQLNFGENYLQEALPKIAALQDYPLVWHFIGHLQRNKAKQIATAFQWVHSLDKLDVAIALNQARQVLQTPLNVCIQVNLYNESSKGGVSIDELDDLLSAVVKLPRLALRGLMTILPQQLDARAGFDKLAELQRHYQQQGFKLDTLSMGMSNDYPAAIEAGATWLRIGTALFGPR